MQPTEFNPHNDPNIKIIEYITTQITHYLNIIMKEPIFIEERGQYDNINKWKNSFLDCQLRINNTLNSLILTFNKFKSNENLVNKWIEIATKLSQNPIMNSVQNNSFLTGTTIANVTAIDINYIYTFLMTNDFKNNEDFYVELSNSYNAYGTEILTLKKLLTSNHFNINPIDSFFQVHQNNELTIALFEKISQVKITEAELLQPNTFNKLN